jgi:hypothetical protein
MNEPYQIMIYRRGGKFWVSPGILSDIGFRSLSGVIPVEHPEDLSPALEQAATQARAAQKLPKDKRFPAGKPFWEAAGFRTWNEFVRGTTAIAVMRLPDNTVLEYDVPDAKSPGLVGTDITREYPADMPLDEVATAALGLFAANPA